MVFQDVFLLNQSNPILFINSPIFDSSTTTIGSVVQGKTYVYGFGDKIQIKYLIESVEIIDNDFYIEVSRRLYRLYFRRHLYANKIGCPSLRRVPLSLRNPIGTRVGCDVDGAELGQIKRQKKKKKAKHPFHTPTPCQCFYFVLKLAHGDTTILPLFIAKKSRRTFHYFF